MVWVVKLIGIVMVALGAIYLVKPAIMKKFMLFWMKEKRLYLGGFLNFLISIVFLVTASKCTVPLVVVILGIVSLIKGLLAFVPGPKKIIPWTKRFVKSPAETLRVHAIIVLGLGALLIYAA